MRIECQKCAAAYAIDDRLVTAKGVRAQCPRCRHLQLVKREAPALPPSPALAAMGPPAAAASGAPGAAGRPPSGPSAPPGLAPRPVPTSSAPVNFGQAAGEAAGPVLPPLPPPPSAPAAAPSFTSLEFEAPIPKPSQPAPPSPRPAPAPSARNELDDLLGPSGAAPGAFAPAAELTGPAAGDALAPHAPAPVIGCRSCGKPLTDSFDQALGLCDPCRIKAAGAGAGDGAPEAMPAPAPAPARAPAPAPAAVVPPQKPVEPPPAPYETRPGNAGYIAPLRTPESTGGGRSAGQFVAMGVIALVVVGGGIGLAVKKPWVKKAPVLANPTFAGPIDDIIGRWRLQFLDLSGTSEDHLKAGEAKLAEDTTSGYADAEEDFQKALVLNPKSDLAVAGYLRALALGRGPRLDDALYQEAVGLIGAAEARSGGAPKVLIAHAELLLTRPTAGNASDARALADRAIVAGNPSEQAQGHLAVGHSFLSTNEVWATAAFEKALALDPTLKRGYFYRAQAHASAGAYKKAIDNLEKRLAVDPDQWEATDSLARFYLDVGEIDSARKTYQRGFEANPNSPRAKIALATMAFQHQGKVQEAVDALRALAADRGKIDDQHDVVEVLIQLVAAERQLGQLPAALQDVNDALAIAPKDAAVHLQALLLALDRKEVAQAKPHLAFIAGQLDDPGLEEELKGRVLFADGRYEEAAGVLTHAFEVDPRRTEALVLAGAAEAAARRELKAYDLVLRRAFAADPGRSAPRPTMTRFYVLPSDLLRPAAGQFIPLSTGSEDPNPELCEGLVQFQLRNFAEADKRLTKAAAIDPASVQAFTLKTLIALSRNDKAAALKLARRALDSDRQAGLAHYVHGLALAASGKDEPAIKELREALARDPKLLGPRVKLGELLRGRSPDEAKKLLLTVVGLDPTYPGAKRALYQLDK